MSLSHKIDLENKIFARAQALGAEVYAKYGRLTSPSEDLQLQTMLYVYNKHFGEENYKQYCNGAEGFCACRMYPRTAGSARVYSLKDFNFELALSEKL